MFGFEAKINENKRHKNAPITTVVPIALKTGVVEKARVPNTVTVDKLHTIKA